MHILQKILAALCLSLTTMLAVATPSAPKEGVDYLRLSRVQPIEADKKVEVTEFFGYFCPHCNEIDHPLTEWVKKQGSTIVFKRVPVAFRESLVPQQKLFYTLEAMGKLDQLHTKVFQAIHSERNRLDTDAAIVEWAAKQGLDKKTFSAMYGSFGVQSKANRATQLQNAYGITGVPTIAIDGQYITSPSIVGASMRGQPESAMHAATFQVMDWLVARAAKEKGVAATPKTDNVPKGEQVGPDSVVRQK